MIFIIVIIIVAVVVVVVVVNLVNYLFIFRAKIPTLMKKPVEIKKTEKQKRSDSWTIAIIVFFCLSKLADRGH